MGRIKDRKKAETRALILDASARVFVEFGFESATLSKIASVASLTPAALCYHFETKQGLFDAVIDAIYKDVAGLVLELNSRPQLTLTEIVEGIYGFGIRHRSAIRLLVRNIIETGGLSERTRQVHMGPLNATAATQLAKKLDVPLHCARETIVVLTHLFTRFITNTDRDNQVALDVAPTDDVHRKIIELMLKVGEATLQPKT